MINKLNVMSVTELKALGYDAVAQMEQAQNNLKAINAELSSRNQTVEPLEAAVPEDKKDAKVQD